MKIQPINEITQEEFKALINEAYYQGMEDAAKIFLDIVKEKKPIPATNLPGDGNTNEFKGG